MDESSALAWRGFLDETYLDQFSKRLKKLYLKEGFIFVDVSAPIIKMNKKNSESSITFKIRERIRCKVKKITIKGISSDFENNILQKLDNKTGGYLNVVALEKDLELVLEEARLQGFYFTKILNSRKKSLLKYSPNFSEVEINIEIETETAKETLFDSFKVLGLKKTKLEVIERQVSLIKGDLLTPEKVRNIKNRLINLGLFSFVKISPFIIENAIDNKNKVNLFIQVKEKDFGMGEVSPGYRTDLGIKLGTMLSYNNLGGMNRLFSVKLQGNLRDSFRDFDERRRKEENKFTEYSAKFLFEEPYLFYSLLKTKVEFDISTSYQKRRYYSFDAKIAKISPTISKLFGKHFLTSLQYQLESIEQKDATELKDNDRFRIGSLIPSFAIDYRDNSVMPRSGNHFAASYEFANRSFGSMEEEDLAINYSKLILRNKNYISFGNFVFASSISCGVETNFAREKKSTANAAITDTKGYIPSIKVFRLEGNDSVRGFKNTEINRLYDGRDIGQVVVNQKAYFINIKLEPRYFINDMLMVALFYDAGRVYLNHFKPLDLRSSFGASFKVLTPVGSLNFDYGVKLNRKRIGSGQEEFGRFHLSVGFF